MSHSYKQDTFNVQVKSFVYQKCIHSLCCWQFHLLTVFSMQIKWAITANNTGGYLHNEECPMCDELDLMVLSSMVLRFACCIAAGFSPVNQRIVIQSLDLMEKTWAACCNSLALPMDVASKSATLSQKQPHSNAAASIQLIFSSAPKLTSFIRIKMQ